MLINVNERRLYTAHFCRDSNYLCLVNMSKFLMFHALKKCYTYQRCTYLNNLELIYSKLLLAYYSGSTKVNYKLL